MDGQGARVLAGRLQPPGPRHRTLRTLRPSRVRARRLPRAPGRPRHRDDDHRSGALRPRCLGTGRWRLPRPDWEAVEYALDQVRQDNGEAPGALTEKKDHETKVRAHLAKPIVVTPPCAACGTPSAPRGNYPPNGSSGRAPCRPASSATPARTTASPDHRPPLPGTATATPSTPPGPGRSPGHSVLRCVPPRSTAGSTTMPGTLRRLRRSLLLPALARSRIRVRFLPPRPQQEPGPALVTVSNQPPNTLQAGHTCSLTVENDCPHSGASRQGLPHWRSQPGHRRTVARKPVTARQGRLIAADPAGFT